MAESINDYREPLLAAIAALEQGAAFCNANKDAWAAAMAEAILHLEDFLVAVDENTADLPEVIDETEGA